MARPSWSTFFAWHDGQNHRPLQPKASSYSLQQSPQRTRTKIEYGKENPTLAVCGILQVFRVGWVEQRETQRQPFAAFKKGWVSFHSTQPTWFLRVQTAASCVYKRPHVARTHSRTLRVHTVARCVYTQAQVARTHGRKLRVHTIACCASYTRSQVARTHRRMLRVHTDARCASYTRTQVARTNVRMLRVHTGTSCAYKRSHVARLHSCKLRAHSRKAEALPYV